MEIYSIGFTQTTAEHFFGRLKDAGVVRLFDVRLNNSSQLSGFAKGRDLPFFLSELVGAEYRHIPELAPTQELLDGYRKEKRGWPWYEAAYRDLLAQRRVEALFTQQDFAEPTALLCSEATAELCHRRVACEYLAVRWPELVAVHL